jgi:putative membrane protein
VAARVERVAPTCHFLERVSPSTADASGWPEFRVSPGMRWIEIDAGRWLLEIRDGLGIELVLLFSRTVAFWRFRGELAKARGKRAAERGAGYLQAAVNSSVDFVRGDAGLREAGCRHNLSRMHSLIVPLVHLLLTAVSVIIVAKILPGITVKSYKSAVFFALVVAVFNAIAWSLMTPLGWATTLFAVVTLGFGVIVVNGLVVLLASKVADGVKISGCITAMLVSVGIWLVNAGMHLVLGKWAPGSPFMQ